MYDSRRRPDRCAASTSAHTTGPRGGIEIELVKEKEKTNPLLPRGAAAITPTQGTGVCECLCIYIYIIVCVYRLAMITGGGGVRESE